MHGFLITDYMETDRIGELVDVLGRHNRPGYWQPMPFEPVPAHSPLPAALRPQLLLRREVSRQSVS